MFWKVSWKCVACGDFHDVVTQALDPDSAMNKFVEFLTAEYPTNTEEWLPNFVCVSLLLDFDEYLRLQEI